MPGYEKFLDPVNTEDQICPECGHVSKWHPGITVGGYRSSCEHQFKPTPGAGSWSQDDDGQTQWRLRDEDEWQTLTPDQETRKHEEEDRLAEAEKKRRTQN